MGKYGYEEIFYLSKHFLTYQVPKYQLTRYFLYQKYYSLQRSMKKNVVSKNVIIKYKLKEVCRQLFMYIKPYLKA